MKHISILILTVSVVFFIIIGMTTSSSTHAAQSPEDADVTRILKLTATNNGEDIVYCVEYSIAEGTAGMAFLTLPFDQQIQFYATDSRSNRIVPKADTDFIPSPPFPVPYYDNTANYLILKPNTSIKSCFLGNFDDYAPNTYILVARFVPWLRREDEFPPNIKSQIMESAIIARPRYRDEVLESNECLVNRRHKTINCRLRSNSETLRN